MLGKLLKHEMRSTAKTFIWLYIAFIVIAAVNALLVPWAQYDIAADSITSSTMPGAVPVILISLYVLAIAAMGIVTIVVIILRFYRNLLGDEGYLMMTLPVTREEHIISKLLVALIWTVCTSVLILLSILLLFASTGNFGDLVQAIKDMTAMGAPLGRWISMFIIIIIISSVSGILMLYAAMAIGPNLLKNRVGGSILAFIIIVVASQIVNAAIFSIWAGSPSGRDINIIVNSSAGAAGMDDGMGFDRITMVLDTVMVGAVIGCAIIGVGCWFWTQLMLKKKLNLA